MALRFTLVALMALNVFISFGDRMNLAVAVTTMETVPGMEFIEKNSGIIFGVFYIGYTINQTIAGYLSDRFGSKWVLFAACFVWSVAEVLTVFAAKKLWSFILIRIILGAGEGLAFPAIHSFIATFMLKKERPTVVAISQAFCYSGSVGALLFTPMIIKYHSWELVFILFGLAGFLWLVPWTVLAANCPATSKWMSEEEKNLIALDNQDEESCKNIVELKEGISKDTQSDSEFKSEESDKLQVPWKKILTSKPVWAVICCQFATGYLFYVLLNYLPKYLEEVYEYEQEVAANLIIIPYVIQFLLTILCGYLNTLNFSKRFRRNAFQLLSMWGSSGLLMLSRLLLSFGFKHLSLVCLFGATVSYAFCVYGVQVSHIDFCSPQYAGIVFGIGNTFGNLAGAVACIISDIVRQALGWTYSFGICALIMVAASIVWIFWSSVEMKIE